MRAWPASVPSDAPASAVIDAVIVETGGWRADVLRKVRGLIHEAVPNVVETVKWGATPIFEHHGIFVVVQPFKKAVNATFAHGAALPDPHGLFNSGFGGNTRRAIDFLEGAALDERALKALFRAAAAHNEAKKTSSKTGSTTASARGHGARGTPRRP